MIYRNNAGRLGSDFIYVSLETGWLGQKPWFLIPGRLLYLSDLCVNCLVIELANGYKTHTHTHKHTM